MAALSALGAVACQAGELNERQERYLRRQLDQHYPNTTGDVSQGTSSQASEAPGDVTSEPADTSAPVDSTAGSAPDTSSAAPSVSSGPDTAGEIPPCVLQTFQSACAGNACHYAGVVNLPPNFETTEDLYTMLTTGPVTCAQAPSSRYVDTANPQNSYLLVKVRGEQPSGCGTQMPPPGSTITQQQLDCLEAWIGSL